MTNAQKKDALISAQAAHATALSACEDAERAFCRARGYGDTLICKLDVDEFQAFELTEQLFAANLELYIAEDNARRALTDAQKALAAEF